MANPLDKMGNTMIAGRCLLFRAPSKLRRTGHSCSSARRHHQIDELFLLHITTFRQQGKERV
jgi:hypothetical protein